MMICIHKWIDKTDENEEKHWWECSKCGACSTPLDSLENKHYIPIFNFVIKGKKDG